MPVVKSVTVDQDRTCSRCKKGIPSGNLAIKDRSHKVTIIREKGKPNLHKRNPELPTLYRHLECQGN